MLLCIKNQLALAQSINRRIMYHIYLKSSFSLTLAVLNILISTKYVQDVWMFFKAFTIPLIILNFITLQLLLYKKKEQ